MLEFDEKVKDCESNEKPGVVISNYMTFLIIYNRNILEKYLTAWNFMCTQKIWPFRFIFTLQNCGWGSEGEYTEVEARIWRNALNSMMMYVIKASFINLNWDAIELWCGSLPGIVMNYKWDRNFAQVAISMPSRYASKFVWTKINLRRRLEINNASLAFLRGARWMASKFAKPCTNSRTDS